MSMFIIKPLVYLNITLTNFDYQIGLSFSYLF